MADSTSGNTSGSTFTLDMLREAMAELEARKVEMRAHEAELAKIGTTIDGNVMTVPDAIYERLTAIAVPGDLPYPFGVQLRKYPEVDGKRDPRAFWFTRPIARMIDWGIPFGHFAKYQPPPIVA